MSIDRELEPDFIVEVQEWTRNTFIATFVPFFISDTVKYVKYFESAKTLVDASGMIRINVESLITIYMIPKSVVNCFALTKFMYAAAQAIAIVATGISCVVFCLDKICDYI